MNFPQPRLTWPIALAAVLVLAATVLLPGLGSSGLWEPQERQFADKQSPRRTGTITELDAMVRPAVLTALAPKPPQPPNTPAPALPLQPPAQDKDCQHVPPHDALARSLTPRAVSWGRDLDDSDAGRRLPLALLGLLTVLATAGIALRTRGPRAALVASLVLLAMPLLVFQSRQLTSEIGTAAGGALMLYGLVALGRKPRPLAHAIADAAVSIAAIVLGSWLGFASGGALLGVLAPVAAFAAAGLVALPAWREGPAVEHVKTIVALLAATVVLGVLVYQLFDLVAIEDVVPGTNPPPRAAGSLVFVPSKCWSSALGAFWRADDDLRFIYDSTFEQIAYGTFPWGVLAPIALFGLLASDAKDSRRVGGIALAWAAATWIAGEIFQRKVGFTLYAGFPALALAIGVWLDELFSQPRRPAASIALFAALAVLVLGKDLFSFADRLPSLLVGGDVVAYPTMSRLLFIPTKIWPLVLGGLLGAGFALALTVRGQAARIAFGTMFGVAALLPAFWAFAWQPELGSHLSSKGLFDTFHELAGPADTLVIMGDVGDAAHDYAPDTHVTTVTTREQVVAALGQPNRVFAIAPQSELCQLHRDLAGKPYFVVDDRNVKARLLSNRVDGTVDKNPLRASILHEEPKDIPSRPKARVVFDNRIQLLGWDIPKTVGKGNKFQVKMFYKVLQPVGGNWKVLFHFDGQLRFNGDHDPIGGLCATATWQPGDYIVDTYTIVAGGGAFSEGPYEVWTGFFTGSAPNWKNMPVSEAPGDLRDTADRVKITTIVLD